MHNKPSENISDPRYKGTTEEQPAEAGDAEQEEAKRHVSRQEAEEAARRCGEVCSRKLLPMPRRQIYSSP